MKVTIFHLSIGERQIESRLITLIKLMEVFFFLLYFSIYRNLNNNLLTRLDDDSIPAIRNLQYL